MIAEEKDHICDRRIKRKKEGIHRGISFLGEIE